MARTVRTTNEGHKHDALRGDDVPSLLPTRARHVHPYAFDEQVIDGIRIHVGAALIWTEFGPKLRLLTEASGSTTDASRNGAKRFDHGGELVFRIVIMRGEPEG